VVRHLAADAVEETSRLKKDHGSSVRRLKLREPSSARPEIFAAVNGDALAGTARRNPTASTSHAQRPGLNRREPSAPNREVGGLLRVAG